MLFRAGTRRRRPRGRVWCSHQAAPPPPANRGPHPPLQFLSLVREDLIKDVVFVWNADAREFHTIIALGAEVAGHPRITHGGLTAAIIDETTGALVFQGKDAGFLGPNAAFTAHLEVDYRRPLPVDVEVICTASLEEVQGRKIWVRAVMRDRPGGAPYAEGKALYISTRSAGGGDAQVAQAGT